MKKPRNTVKKKVIKYKNKQFKDAWFFLEPNTSYTFQLNAVGPLMTTVTNISSETLWVGLE